MFLHNRFGIYLSLEKAFKMETDIHVDSPLEYASIQILLMQNWLVSLLYLFSNWEVVNEILSFYYGSSLPS